MDKSSLVLVCALLACSVWMIQGKHVTINNGNQDQNEVEVSAGAKVPAWSLPGSCWACNWALKKVKKLVGNNATVEALKSKLLSICNQIGSLKSLCKKLVKSHLGVLIEELTTTDDVHTICVNIKACKSKELLMEPHYPEYIESQIAAEVFSEEYMED